MTSPYAVCIATIDSPPAGAALSFLVCLLQGFTGLAIDGKVLDDQTWYVYPLELRYGDGWAANLPWAPTPAGGAPPMAPAFYKGVLTITGTPTDTYLHTCGWGRGHVWINGFELGRYWDPLGPQHTLYVPAPVLKSGANEILLFEVNRTTPDVSVSFIDFPDWTQGDGCAASAAEAHQLNKQVLLDPVVASSAVKRGVPHPDARALASAGVSEFAAQRMSPPSALGSTVALTAGACAAPVAGTNLTLQPCANAGTAAQWTLVPPKAGVPNAGRFQLASTPGLCIGVQGTNPDTGSPNLAAVPCVTAPGDRSQDFIWFLYNSNALMSVATGSMMDVPNSDSQAGARLELYAGNGGYKNQQFAWDAASGHITSALNGYCVAAC